MCVPGKRISFALLHTFSIRFRCCRHRTASFALQPYRQPHGAPKRLPTPVRPSSACSVKKGLVSAASLRSSPCVLLFTFYVQSAALWTAALSPAVPPFQPRRAALRGPVLPEHTLPLTSRCEAFESLKIYFSYKCHCTVKWMSHFSNLYFNLSVSKFEGLKFKVFRTGRKKFKIFSFPICEFPICL